MEVKQVERVESPMLLARIGKTPLVPQQSPNPHVQMLGKAEWSNPGGSVKGGRHVRFLKLR